LRFVAGQRKQSWIKNCVALGLASGFLEPLESTSIHLVQTAIAKMMFYFPSKDFDQTAIDKYNALARTEYEEVRDFLVLHYKATERNDTPFWRHCQNIRKPDSLRAKWETYESHGHITTPPGELFREPSWFAVYTGQNVIPRHHHPFADIPSDAELASRFQRISEAVRARVDSFPTHDEYIRRNCAAPPLDRTTPMPGKTM
jgi:tryptophan halogenase